MTADLLDTQISGVGNSFAGYFLQDVLGDSIESEEVDLVVQLQSLRVHLFVAAQRNHQRW